MTNVDQTLGLEVIILTSPLYCIPIQGHHNICSGAFRSPNLAYAFMKPMKHCMKGEEFELEVTTDEVYVKDFEVAKTKRQTTKCQ